MARRDHQPQDIVPEHPQPSIEQLRERCGNSVAFVRALDAGTTPLVVMYDDPGQAPDVLVPAEGQAPVARPLQRYREKPCVQWAIECALDAQVAAVFVHAAPQIAGEIEEIAGRVASSREAAQGVRPMIEVVPYDAQEDRRATREAQEFELFGVTYGQLAVMHAHAERAVPGYDGLFVVPADVVRLTPGHLHDLAQEVRAHPQTEAVASWIAWLRRPPYLFTRTLLAGLAEDPRTRPDDYGYDRPAPLVAVIDHVFGEEKVVANPVVSQDVQAFLGERTLSAVQAVRLGKWSLEHPGEDLVSPVQVLSLLAPARPAPLTDADRAMVDAAKRVLEALESEGPAEGDLAWADAFGRAAKRDFPLLNDRAHAENLVYLDSAATAQRVDVALQAQRDYDVHENANVYRGSYGLSAQSTFTYNDARQAIEDFIGAERRTTALVSNTSAACNLVAQAWGEHNIGQGDLIVVPVAEHHSNMLPFAMLAQRKGARLEYLPYDALGHVDRAAFDAALQERPKLVCIAMVGNTFGVEEPVADLAEAAHAAGARVLVDAAQAFPHKRIDVGELGADWVAFSGHKAYGPTGIGGLWIAPEAFDEMDPVAGGGGTVSHVSTSSYYLRPKVIQYELGTPAVSQAVGLAAALGYLQALGMENVARHAAALTRYLVAGLHALDGVCVIGNHEHEHGQTGLVSFTVRGVTPDELADFLGKLDVCIRSGGHCALPLHAALGLVGTGRISFGVYNTLEDVEAALTAIALCRELYEG